jgi:hypothetical protein
MLDVSAVGLGVLSVLGVLGVLGVLSQLLGRKDEIRKPPFGGFLSHG